MDAADDVGLEPNRQHGLRRLIVPLQEKNGVVSKKTRALGGIWLIGLR